MTVNPFTAAALFAMSLAASARAEITIEDAYGRTASPMARTGAIYLVIHNSGNTDDRLIAVASSAAGKVALHSNVDLGEGILAMTETETGLVIAAGGTLAMMRGGDHVMFMGLTGPWAQDNMIPVTLTFLHAAEISLEVPVDLTRKPVAQNN